MAPNWPIAVEMPKTRQPGLGIDTGHKIARRALQHRVSLRNGLVIRWLQRNNAGNRIAFAGTTITQIHTLATRRTVIQVGRDAVATAMTAAAVIVLVVVVLVMMARHGKHVGHVPTWSTGSPVRAFESGTVATTQMVVVVIVAPTVPVHDTKAGWHKLVAIRKDHSQCRDTGSLCRPIPHQHERKETRVVRVEQEREWRSFETNLKRVL